MPTERRYERLYGAELQRLIAQRALAWVPLGPLEKHGEHLPWGLDGDKAHRQCLRLSARWGGVVLPPIHIAGIHDPWHNDPAEYRRLRAEVGDFYLRTETLTMLIEDLIDGLANIGFRIIVLNTGHYPQVQGVLLKQLATRLSSSLGVTIIAFDEDDALTDAKVDHAGVYESSMYWSLGGEHHLERVRPEQANKTGYYNTKTPPGDATFEKGLAWSEQIERWFAARFAAMGLQPIHEASHAGPERSPSGGRSEGPDSVRSSTPQPGSHHTIRPGIYQHYKGNYYEVLGIAHHSEDQQPLVIYRALYGKFGSWARPLAMFIEDVAINGQRIPRFKFVADGADRLA